MHSSNEPKDDASALRLVGITTSPAPKVVFRAFEAGMDDNMRMVVRLPPLPDSPEPEWSTWKGSSHGVSLPATTRVYSHSECKALSKQQIEEYLGKPVPCHRGSEDAVCFSKAAAFVTARFDAAGHATSVMVDTMDGPLAIMGVLNQIAPEKARGRYLKRVEKSRPYACEHIYLEEYEHLSLEYAERQCMGSAPVTIKVGWKKCPNANDAA